VVDDYTLEVDACCSSHRLADLAYIVPEEAVAARTTLPVSLCTAHLCSRAGTMTQL